MSDPKFRPAGPPAASPSGDDATLARGPYDLPEPELHWQNGQPISTRFGDVYFSRDSGLAEVEHVFLAGNDLENRFRALPADSPGVFCIGETGFGTGLNLLVTWQLWQRCAPPGWRLHWLSTELYPLDRAQLQQALQVWPQLGPAAAALLAVYPTRISGFHWRWLVPGEVSVGLWYGDAAAGLADLLDSGAPELASAGPRVDAWVLDGFAPARNPGMWHAGLYRQLRAWSRPGTTFATFTAAGHVRRNLQAHGFSVEKCSGFGSKRDMLRGIFSGRIAAAVEPAKPVAGHAAAKDQASEALATEGLAGKAFASETPTGETWANADPPDLQSPAQPRKAAPINYWATPWLTPPLERSAIVIGGGLAGSSTALALARRGWQVRLVDRSDRIAAGASGNAQGVLYTRFSAQPDPLSQFSLSSYLYALRHYRELAASGRLGTDNYDFCGVLQLPADLRQAQRQREAAIAFGAHPELVQPLELREAEQRAGISLPQGGLWLPQAGWLSPAAVCRAQLDHPGIAVQLATTVTGLQRNGDRWQVQLTSGASLDSELVVVCSGADSEWLAPWMTVPTRAIRGQVSHISPVQATPSSTALQCVLCHEGYVTTTSDGGLWIGATFDPDDRDPELRPEDHQRNLASLAAAIPALVGPGTAVDAGRVGFRAASPDYLPLAGPLPAQPHFDQTYAPLRDNARRAVAELPPLLSGLLLNVGHGSRGLTSTPLCAEWIAALASGEPRPIDRGLMQIITPVRFAARGLVRSKR